MFNGMTTVEIVKMLAPLIILELCLKVCCFYRLYKDKVKFFPKYIWAIIILVISTIGPLGYLLIGRKKD
jgi:chloramphenicol O-acetyltransferase